MPTFRLLTLVISLVTFSILTAVITWASVESNVIIGFNEMFSSRWGLATLVDIYIAFTFIGIWIGVIERSWTKGILWTLALYALGDLTTLIYVVIRSFKCNSFVEMFTPNKV